MSDTSITDVLSGAARWSVVHGEALATARSLPDASVGLLWSDGPYGIGKAAWDRLTPAQMVEFYRPHLAEWRRVLAPNGSLYLCAAAQRAAQLEVLTGDIFDVLTQITWTKPNDPGFDGWKQKTRKESLRTWYPSSERIIFAEQHGSDGYARGEAGYVGACDRARGFVFEPILRYLLSELRRSGRTRREIDAHFGTANVSQYWFQPRGFIIPTAERYEGLRLALNGGPLPDVGGYLRREYDDLRREYDDLRREYDDLRRPFAVTADVPYTDVWTFPTVTPYRGKHPCEKPAAMLDHVVAASSRPDMLVFDPFAGSGSMGRAALAAGRRYIGCDLDEHWAAVARGRCGSVEIGRARIANVAAGYPPAPREIKQIAMFPEVKP